MNQDIQEGSPSCEVCHCVENLKTCSRCHSAFYCRREHQILHWEVHKRVCKNFRSDQQSTRATAPEDCQSTSVTSSAQSSANGVSVAPYATWCANTSFIENTNTSEGKIMSPEQSYTEWDINNLVTQDPSVTSPTLDQTSSPASETSETSDLQLDNDFLDFAKYLFPGSAPMDYDLTSVTEQIFEDNACPSPTMPANVRMQEVELAGGMPFEHVCNSVVHDLNVHGICVIDNFLGMLVGEQILREVKSLFQRGVFQKGQLVNSSMWKSTESIRGDLISWVSGTEVGCEYIGTLIRKLDDVMNHSSKMKDNGILSRYKLDKRTKAMVACYPGNGTHYKKHVDNPDGDGRCITCIYYLNKNWDVNKHGGLLRMFPTSHADEVANINPEFDRMLFFWSDRRNPHEVLPSHAVRFAITVWYFDSDERQLALIRSSLQQKQ